MNRAVDAITSKKIVFFRAATTYNVPKSTLKCHVKKARNNIMNEGVDSGTNYGKKCLGCYKTVLTKVQEDELCEYIKSMPDIFWFNR